MVRLEPSRIVYHKRRDLSTVKNEKNEKYEEEQMTDDKRII